jgi:hypothetical protein
MTLIINYCSQHLQCQTRWLLLQPRDLKKLTLHIDTKRSLITGPRLYSCERKGKSERWVTRWRRKYRQWHRSCLDDQIRERERCLHNGMVEIPRREEHMARPQEEHPPPRPRLTGRCTDAPKLCSP